MNFIYSLFFVFVFQIKLIFNYCVCRKQVKTLFYAFCGSFSSALFQWFFAAADGCGFGSFPTFGLKAFKQRLGLPHFFVTNLFDICVS